jgi:hypothetical protein
VKNPWRTIGDPTFKDSSHGDWTGKFGNDDNVSWTTDLLSRKGKLEKGEFYMPIEDFKAGFKYYTITYMHDEWKNSFIEKRSSVSKRVYKFNFTISEEDYTPEDEM